MKVQILPVFIRRDKLSDDDLDAANIYYHIDGGECIVKRNGYYHWGLSISGLAITIPFDDMRICTYNMHAYIHIIHIIHTYIHTYIHYTTTYIHLLAITTRFFLRLRNLTDFTFSFLRPWQLAAMGWADLIGFSDEVARPVPVDTWPDHATFISISCRSLPPLHLKYVFFSSLISLNCF